MYIFFDAVSRNGYIAAYNTLDMPCFAEEHFSIMGNESTKTIEVLSAFVEKYDIKYEQIQNVLCVVGPGSFTGVRTISLTLNTLAFTYPNIHLTPVNFFDLYNQYPVVKSSSKRDLFVKYTENDIIHIETNDVFTKNTKSIKIIYGDIERDRFGEIFDLRPQINYNTFIASVKLQQNKSLAPLYIKKPNIS